MCIIKQLQIVEPILIHDFHAQVQLHYDKFLTIKMTLEKLHCLAICVVDLLYKFVGLKLCNSFIYARDPLCFSISLFFDVVLYE